jgi:hypothetical protein
MYRGSTHRETAAAQGPPDCEIGFRKEHHLPICTDPRFQIEGGRSGFEPVHFIHLALPLRELEQALRAVMVLTGSRTLEELRRGVVWLDQALEHDAARLRRICCQPI